MGVHIPRQAIGTLSDALVDYVRVYKSTSTLGLKDNTNLNTFSLYPNPAKKIVTIRTETPNYSLKIYDLQGRVILNSDQSVSDNVDVSSFNKGIYLFQITANNSVSTHRIIVN